MGIADVFADAEVTRTINLLRFAEGVREKMLLELATLEDTLVKFIDGAGIDDAVRQTTKFRRMERLLKDVRGAIKTTYSTSAKTMKNELVALAGSEQAHSLQLFKTVFDADIVSGTLSPSQLRGVVRSSVVQGTPSSAWWGKQGRDLQFRFESEMRLGIIAGETNRQLVQRLRGASTGARRVIGSGAERRVVREFSGGIMNISRREATALVRTGVQNVANQTKDALYRENQDLFAA